MTTNCLDNFNYRMKQENWNVIHFQDNATLHLADLHIVHVNLVFFLPVSTPSLWTEALLRTQVYYHGGY